MGKSILITGGARSGKSKFAEDLAMSLGQNAVYIATAQAFDGEMSARIDAHKSRRGNRWSLVEEPLQLTDALRKSDGHGPRLVDCLTLWLSNLMLAELDWQAATNDVVQLLTQQETPVLFVTNEVGAGIVPDNALARDFRDAAGTMNQRIAAAVDDVHLVVAGIPMKVK